MTTNSITPTELSLPQCPYTFCRRACALSVRLRLHTPPAAYHHTDHVHDSSFLGYRSWRRPNGFMRSSSGSSSVSRRRSLSASHSGCASGESSGSNCRPSPLPLLDAASSGRVSPRNLLFVDQSHLLRRAGPDRVWCRRLRTSPRSESLAFVDWAWCAHHTAAIVPAVGKPLYDMPCTMCHSSLGYTPLGP